MSEEVCKSRNYIRDTKERHGAAQVAAKLARAAAQETLDVEGVVEAD